MVQHHIVTKIVFIWISTMVNDGQPLSNVALWQMLSEYENQSYSTIFQCCIVKNNYLKVYNIHLRVHIPWVNNMYPLGLILFPWAYNPLGLLFPWIYNIYLRVYIPLAYNINPLGLYYQSVGFLVLIIWVYYSLGFIISIPSRFIYLAFIILIDWV